jgi:hypothetical protein
MMKALITTALALCLSLAAPLGTASASGDAKGKATSTQKTAKKMPSFVPTNVGSPTTRLGGATRSAADEIPRTEALVPEISGHTLIAQPVIYWYLTAPTEHRIEFKLIDVDSGEALVKTTLAPIPNAGIQRIRLADHAVNLEPGVDYQWFVAIVPNPDERLYDRIIGGGIERVASTEELQSQLASTADAEAYFALAEAGIWYDALDSLNRQIEAAPGDTQLIAQRRSLLDQVGLGSVN